MYLLVTGFDGLAFEVHSHSGLCLTSDARPVSPISGFQGHGMRDNPCYRHGGGDRPCRRFGGGADPPIIDNYISHIFCLLVQLWLCSRRHVFESLLFMCLLVRVPSVSGCVLMFFWVSVSIF